MSEIWKIIGTVIGVLVVAVFLGWQIWRAVARSDDRPSLIVKLLVTAFLLGVVVFVIFPMVARFDLGSIAGILFLAAVAVVIGLMWGPSWSSMMVSPLTDMIDGGNADGEVVPQYSVAEARRARGQFNEAVAEIRRQLEHFPNDLRLQLMHAELCAEHLNDLQGAESIILRISRQQHSPANISSAFQELADWHLKFGNDPDSARLALERIIESFPETQFAQSAAQRIAHLSSVDQLLAHRDLRTIKLKEYERDLGLKPHEANPEESATASSRAKELLEHLQRHPLDNEAREELARVYADEYQRVDLAVDQLEELIARPSQKSRDIVRWLNLAADLHIKVANDIQAAEAALRRLIDLFPNSAGAEMARVRLATLNQELNRNKKRQAIKLGVYEKDIGLKARKSPAQ